MKISYNLTTKEHLIKFQNMWVAFDMDKNIIASGKTYSKLFKAIPEKLKQKVDVTFLSSSDAYLAP